MAATDDFDDFGFPEPPVVTIPSKANLNVVNNEDLDDEGFDPIVETEAKPLRTIPPVQRLLELWKRTGPKDFNLVAGLPFSEWRVDLFLNFCAASGALGSTKGIKVPLGEGVYDPMSPTKDANIKALEQSLVQPKTKLMTIETDQTLLLFASSLPGAVLENFVLQVPGAPALKISPASPRYRILGGGQEFVNWYNAVYNGNLLYVHVSGLARAHTLFLLSSRNLTNVDPETGTLTWAEVKHAKHPLVGFFKEGTMNLYAYLTAIEKYVGKAYANPETRPTMGWHDMVPFVEVCLTRAYSKVSPKTVTAMTDVVNKALVHARGRWEKIVDDLPWLFSPGEKNGPMIPPGRETIKAMATGGVCLPGQKTPLRSAGMILQFVTDSRFLIRDNIDMVRKSDSPGDSGSCASASSVPMKIATAIRALKGMTGLTSFPSVDAWGTHVSNHWENEVCSVAKEVMFRDKDRKMAPTSGVRFTDGNIEFMEDGVGKGKFLFDDTYNGTNNAEPDMGPKVRAVIRAHYEGGFMKMYYGAGIDKLGAVSSLPVSTELMMGAYERVWISDGGSPHSPEYFLVFSHPRGEARKEQWRAPSQVLENGNAIFPYPTQNLVEGDATNWNHAILKMMLLTKAAEMLKSNVNINAQVASCVASYLPFISAFPHDLSGRRLAGSYDLNPRANPLAHPTDELYFDDPELILAAEAAARGAPEKQESDVKK